MKLDTHNLRSVERAIKGFANHRRLEVLILLESKSELSVAEISEHIKSDFKNVSAHLNKLAIAGLVMKRSDGHNIRHALTNRGKQVLKFVRTLE